ncbi:transcriptional repressor, CopY family [Alkaliphilus metalliredigens QYMF]|uniref:Transcriptional repressor, CopY family n=1 Tax=Alkaliphilus metalliredigens (strain QYMF) TaxID=293826 RepID=A6TX84_ALKMQ|nr:BlaI/MecI/CopY family transcriptional regulator [Alkaliphilus metalliredigens]ABR50802.1 transcriptional repressor, CopY family [Alkaliphilus metalliredigens QYMF]
MKIKLFDSELKVMEVLWREGNLTAGQLALILKEETGWNRNTTYTVIKKCIDKDAIERLEPNFICRALLSKEEIQEQETEELINKMFDGSTEMFFATFVNEKNLTKEQIDKLKKIVDKLK